MIALSSGRLSLCWTSRLCKRWAWCVFHSYNLLPINEEPSRVLRQIPPHPSLVAKFALTGIGERQLQRQLQHQLQRGPSCSEEMLAIRRALLQALLILPAAALQPRRVHLVVNPYGGGGAGLATLDSVLPVFEAAGVEVTTLITEYAGHAGEMARTVPLLDGFVGIGGDGTAHEIANGMLQVACLRLTLTPASASP